MSNGHIEERCMYTIVDYKGYCATVWWFGIIYEGKLRMKLGNTRAKAIRLLDKLRERGEEMEGYNEEEFKAEVERLILSSPPHQQLKMRAMQAKCDGIRRKKHWTKKQKASAILVLMMEIVEEFRDALKGINKDK